MDFLTAAELIVKILRATKQPNHTQQFDGKDRDFIAGLIHIGAKADVSRGLTPAQEKWLINLYYRHCLMPYIPEESAEAKTNRAKYSKRPAGTAPPPQAGPARDEPEPPF